MLVLLSSSWVHADELTLSASSETSTDGVTRLDWNIPEAASVIIQKDVSADFVNPVSFYKGRDKSTVITGLMDGEYYFRGKLDHQDGRTSSWSKAVQITVKHHPLTRAMLFFFIGLVVFIMTVILVFAGARNQASQL